MSGFEHSLPVPRSYKLAAKIARQVKEEGANLKSLLYEDKNKHFPVQAVHALVVKTLTHENHLSDLLTKTGLLIAEPRFNPWLARVLITELLFGKKTLASESKPVQTIRQYHKHFLSLLESLDIKVEDVVKRQVKPRYIRINTLRLSAADAVRYFQDQGWNLVRCTAGSYDDFLRQVEKLGQYDFMPDYHVKVVFVFAPDTLFYDCELYHNNEIFLQDKATCLAAFILAPTPGSTVLDMCAAPGMKTTHLAALMRNEGTIYAVEQDEERYGILCDFIEKSGATCVKPFNKDVMTVKKDDCPNVDYVLLDPSCSGSGIRRIESNDAAFDLDSGRVEKLANLQAKILRHALNEYSTAKRIVYSTCSLYSQENEAVIDDVIRNHKGKFRLVSAREKLGKWNNVGDWKHEDIGDKCIYARSESDYTSGFFVAVFERFDDDTTVVENVNEKNFANNPSADKPRNFLKNNNHKIVELNDLNNGDMHEEEMETFEEESGQYTFTDNVVNSYDGNSDTHIEVESNFNEGNSIDEKPKKKNKSKTEFSLEETVVKMEIFSEKSKQKLLPESTELIEPFDHQAEVIPIKTKKNKKKLKDSDISLSNELTMGIVASVDKVSTPVKIKKNKKTKKSNPLLSDQTVDETDSIPVKPKKHKIIEELNTLLSVQIIDAVQDIPVKSKKHKKTKELNTLSSVQIIDAVEDIPGKPKKHKKTEESNTLSSVHIIDAVENIPVKPKKHKITEESNAPSSVLIIDAVEDIPVKPKKHKKSKESNILSNVQVDYATEDIRVKSKKDKMIEKESETIVIESTDTILAASDNIPLKFKKHTKKQKDVTLDIETVELIEKSTKKDESKKKTKEFEAIILTSDSSSVSLVVEETKSRKKYRKEKKKQSKENANVDSNIIDIVDSPAKKKKRKHSNNVEKNTQTKSKASSSGSDCLIISDAVTSEKKHKKKKSKAE